MDGFIVQPHEDIQIYRAIYPHNRHAVPSLKIWTESSNRHTYSIHAKTVIPEIQ